MSVQKIVKGIGVGILLGVPLLIAAGIAVLWLAIMVWAFVFGWPAL